jgi:HEPN domain-containing protein
MAMNVEKQVRYWREGAAEDLHAAHILLEKGCARHALFFAHLALEKPLKAHVVRRTGDLAPKMHILPRLMELTGLSPAEGHHVFIKRFDRYQIMGRYPESPGAPIDVKRARRLMNTAREVFQWLTDQF